MGIVPILMAFLKTHYKLAGVILALGVAFYSGWAYHKLVIQADNVQQLEEALDAQHKADQERFNHDLINAKAQALIDNMNENLNQKLENEISKTPNNCIIDPSRVRLINQAASRK